MASWLLRCLIAGGLVDLALRQVARGSLAELLGLGTGPAMGITLVAVLLLVAGQAVLVGVEPPSADGRTRRADRLMALALVAAFAVGLVVQPRLGARLQSDGFYYFAYLRSLWFDGDVDFTNDYKLLGQGDKTHLFEPTPTGYAQSAWTIGPALAWSPFFGAGHLVATRLQQRGHDVKTDGTSYPYRQAVCVAGLLYGLVGIWLCYALARRFVSARLAATAAAVTSAGSFMLWYLVKEPTMTHAPSMAAVAAFTLAWATTRDRRTIVQWVALGLGAGLMTTIRWQNALFALLPLIESLRLLWTAGRHRDGGAARPVVLGGLAFTAAAVVGFVPQMLAWKAIYGQYLAVSPVGPAIRWYDPQVIDILWSSRNGLLSVSPVLYAGAVGLLALVPRAPRFAVPAVITVGAMVYFNASIQDWWGSAGFGMRRFDGVIPLFTVGLAVCVQLLRRAVERYPVAIVASLLAALVLWNATFMQAALEGHVQIGEATSFGELASRQARTLHRWFGHPFSYPVNLLYALRNRVSPARYDLLGPNRFFGDPLRPYGRVNLGLADEALIGAGWHAPERDGDVPFRWASGTVEAIMPFDHASDLETQIRVKPLMFGGAPEQRMWVRVNGRPHGPFRLAPGWQVVVFETDGELWRAGVNRVVLEFSRQDRPRDVGLGGDTRLLSAAVDYLRVQKLGSGSGRID